MSNSDHIRHVAAAVVIHQLVSSATAQVSDDPALSQQEYISVLSQKNLASLVSVEHGTRLALNFIEDLFAVRLPKLIIFSVIFSIGMLLVFIVPLVFDEILWKFNAPRNWRAVINYALRVSIFLATLALALAAVGVDFVGFIFSVGVVAIVLGAGLQLIVSNISGGVWIQVNDIVEVGHEIDVNGIRGIVVETNLGYVVVRLVQPPHNLKFIPNSWLVQFPVERFSTDAIPFQQEQPPSVVDQSRLAALVLNHKNEQAQRQHTKES